MRNGEMQEAKAGKPRPHSCSGEGEVGEALRINERLRVRETGIPSQQNKEEKSVNNFGFEPEGLAS